MRKSMLVVMVSALIVSGLLLAGCTLSGTTTAAVDTCLKAEVGGIAGFHGTFTMDGRPATQQEIADRTVGGPDPNVSDSMWYVHVKSRVDDATGSGYTAELDPGCVYAAANRAKRGQ
jgi:hypothetical protein